MAPTIQTDVDSTENGSFDTLDDAADAILNRWNDAKEPSENDEEANSETETEINSDAEDNEAQTQEETDEDSSEDPDEIKLLDDEDYYVKVTVDGEEQQVSVKELKRLAGQEASLTRKSQEVAEVRKVAEENAKVHLIGLQKLLEKAEDRYKPYANIDWNLAAKEYDRETYEALRDDAVKSYQDIQFLTQELTGYIGHLEQERAIQYQHQAVEAIKVLTDPKTGIEGFGEEMYNQIRDYATSNGLSRELVNSITDPTVIKILHKAMKFDSIKQVSTQKKAQAPKKVLKAKGSLQSSKNPNAQKVQRATDMLKQRGSVQDAAHLLMARWGMADE